MGLVAEAAAVGHRAVVVASVGLAVAAEVSVAVAPARAGNAMRTKEFLSKLEHDRIVQAIRDAESKTSGEIRVFIQRGKLNGDPLVAAHENFIELGMHKTPERNAVLIFVAPRAHKFAVVGDEGDPREMWRDVVATSGRRNARAFSEREVQRRTGGRDPRNRRSAGCAFPGRSTSDRASCRTKWFEG